MGKDFAEQGKKVKNAEDNGNNSKKGLTEDELKELYEDYSRVFDYEPTEEEVRNMYSDEFNEKWDNFKVE